MYRRTARTNRVVFALLGLLLLAVGGYLLVRHENRITASGQSAHERLYTRAQASWLHQHSWIWFAVAAAAVVVGLVALRWLLVQPRIDRVHRVYLDPDPDQAGRTAMSADVLTHAVENDITDYVGVARARALLVGAADTPELVLRVSANPLVDLSAIHRRIVGEALPAVRTSFDSELVPVQVHLLVVGRRTARRVVL